MPTQYSIQFINASQMSKSFLCYQEDPNIGVPDVVSLAWFAKMAHPNTKVVFKWNIDYSFVWSETGNLSPGVTFLASETQEADPAGTGGPNQIAFNYNAGAYQFGPSSSTGAPGSLTINTGGGFPYAGASVGIGMSNSPSFAVPAAPNFNYMFTPHPEYWIAFGTFDEGEVLDITAISTKAKVVFPPNVYSMTATYTASGKWSIQPTSQVNALIAEGGLVDYLNNRRTPIAPSALGFTQLNDGGTTNSPKKESGVRIKGINGKTYSHSTKVTVYNKTTDKYAYQVMSDNTDVTLSPGGDGDYRVTNNSGAAIQYEWQ